MYRIINFFRPVYRYFSCIHASFLTGTLLFCVQMNCDAAEPVEKILVNADRMNMNIESGYSVYTGNVRVSQGELVLTGDKVTLKQNNNNEIEHMTVDGKPARYNHVTEKGEPIEAESEHMVYNASQNQLIMTINARLKQSDLELNSQKIVYDTLKKIIVAGGDDKAQAGKATPASVTSPQSGKKPETSQRVNITLTPKKQLSPEEPDAK
ncbi:MAG: lipopolysaccharide transport periplasmic protein LptA [Gammaproteobacteria bacterium]|nr:lipopolysaccharide transport periplasmic protein LptA [Gammaproteobacteria bacterium]